MKRAISLSVVALTATLALPASANARTWNATPDMHSETEVSFTSKAAIVKFTGRTAKVDGFGDINIENPAKDAQGEVRVDLSTLDTGMPLRNDHMKATIEVSKYPAAVFILKTLKAPKLDANKPVEGTVTGDFTLHGVTRLVTAPVTLTFLPEEDKKYRPGDWVAVSTDFKIRLSEYAINLPKPVLGIKVSDELSIHLDGMAKGI